MGERAAELAYLEGVRALSEQQDSVESARNRVGAALTVATVGTGFVAPAALEAESGMPWLGWTAIGLLLLTVGASVLTMWPRPFRWTTEARQLASETWAGRTDDEVNRLVAGYLTAHAEHNDSILRDLWIGVRVAVTAAALSILAWVLLLAGV